MASKRKSRPLHPGLEEYEYQIFMVQAEVALSTLTLPMLFRRQKKTPSVRAQIGTYPLIEV